MEKLIILRKSADYIVRFLKSNINLNDIHYNFYDYNNSQLKSKSYLLFANFKTKIALKINALKDFSKIKIVAKKIKRIKFFFFIAQIITEIKPNRYKNIPDILIKNYIFTDSCGLISKILIDLLI
jgi:hypothetical protein